jgi:hypothetical protein
MATTADLPVTAALMANPLGAGAYAGHVDALRREERMTWRVPHADFEAFIAAVLFKQETIGTLTRFVPLLHPYAAGLYALGIDFHAFSPNDEVDVDLDPYPWKAIDCAVTFGPLPYTVEGANPFLSIRGRANPKRITRPNTPYSIITDADAFLERVAQDITIPSGEIAIEITWHEIVDLPAALAIVVPLLDRTNSTPLSIPIIGLDAEAGTIHFQSTDFGLSVNTGANIKSTLGISLLYRDRDWNRVVASKDPHKGDFLRLDPPAFRTADLTPLVT